MKNTIIISALVFLSACGMKNQGSADSPTYTIQQSFVPYVKRFQAEAMALGKNYSVNNLVVILDDTMAGPDGSGGSWILGTCTIYSNEPATIRINPYFWNNAGYSNSEREELIFHEMGHCILGRGHNSATAPSSDSQKQVPLTIMNPYHLGHTVYEGNFDYYMKELFMTFPTITLYSAGKTQWDGSLYNNFKDGGNTTVAASSTTGSQLEAKTYTTTAEQGPLNEGGVPTITGMACGDDD